MPKIFICYRREDTKWPAQWIYNYLTDYFDKESVVFDVDSIPIRMTKGLQVRVSAEVNCLV